jgi:Fur family ferric uptake transcriptional regulator
VGLKRTKGRDIIFRELETLKNHFNAEKLYVSLLRKGARVSRPTIYRTLKLLEKLHFIEKLDVKKNCFYYEPMYGKKNHGHLICEKCGKIVDFASEHIQDLKSEVFKEKNFKLDNISIQVFGICETCQKPSKTKS